MSGLALAIYSGSLIGFGFMFGLVYGTMYSEKTRAKEDVDGN